MTTNTESTDLVGLTDEALVLACRRGDNSAWEELVKRYQRLVFSIPRRAGLDEAVSADVFQHVFATLLNKLDQLKDPSKVRAWLITTTKRESWRVSKQQNESVSIDLDDQEEGDKELHDEAPLPDEVILRLEEQQLVRIALTELGAPCQELLELLFYRPQPGSYDEIAAALHIPIGSIGPTRVRCLHKLRAALTRMGY